MECTIRPTGCGDSGRGYRCYPARGEWTWVGAAELFEQHRDLGNVPGFTSSMGTPFAPTKKRQCTRMKAELDAGCCNGDNSSKNPPEIHAYSRTIVLLKHATQVADYKPESFSVPVMARPFSAAVRAASPAIPPAAATMLSARLARAVMAPRYSPDFICCTKSVS